MQLGKRSILRNLLLSFLGFGIIMGIVFPFYANVFVDWKPGMLPWFVVGCLVAGITLGLINYALVNIVLLSKLRRLSDVARAIGNKDISHFCTLESADMVGSIAESFNKMTANLRDLISLIMTMSGNVAGSADTIQTVMEQVRRRFADGRTGMEDIVGSVRELSVTAEGISRDSLEVSETAHKAAETARNGGEVIEETIRSIDHVSRFVADSSRQVAALGQRSEEIGQIVNMINDIAEQSNLLALNAAIEAARAGDQGRGFAVVADEVRKLAQKTATATDQVGRMVASIQEETSAVVAAMERSADEVSTGERKAQQAGAALHGIVTGIEGVTTMIEGIAESLRSQNEFLEQTRDRLAGVDRLLDETLEDTIRGERESASLAGQTAELDRTVQQFRLQPGDRGTTSPPSAQVPHVL